MARITAVIFLLSSVIGIDAVLHHASQVRNVTRLEKRSSMMEVENEFKCDKATYKKDTLYDFVYKHHCFPQGWEDFLPVVRDEINKISRELFNDAKWFQIEPPMPDVFKAFTVSSRNVRAVILGQDPTPQAGKATGLAFSLKPGVDPRDVPSVFNMLVELKWEGIPVGLSNGDLSPWLGQGVLLLNSALTVRQGKAADEANSHKKYWAGFTKSLVNHINEARNPTAWLLWGAEAKNFEKYIKRGRHMVKAGAHPRVTTGFYGRNYFHCASEFLQSKNRGRIDWRLPEVQESFAKFIEGCGAEGLGDE